MTTPGASNVEALDTLAAAARLLSRAADTAWAQADPQPLSVFAGLALGAAREQPGASPDPRGL